MARNYKKGIMMVQHKRVIKNKPNPELFIRNERVTKRIAIEPELQGRSAEIAIVDEIIPEPISEIEETVNDVIAPEIESDIDIFNEEPIQESEQKQDITELPVTTQSQPLKKKRRRKK